MSPALSAVLITAPDEARANAIARGLVKARLAACVNVLPGLTSFYVWEGKLNEDSEALLIAKTRARLLPQLCAFVRARHPAKVPEIIALPIAGGDKAYLDWVAATARAR